MHCGDMRKKISEMQLFPVAFNSSLNSTSWVSLKNETQASASGYNIDYLVIQKPKSRTSFNNIIAYLISHPFPWHVLMFISIFLNYVVISYVYFFVQPKTEIIWPFYLIVACDVLYMLDVVFGVIVFVNNNLSHHATETRNVLLGLDALLSLPYSYVCLAAIRNTQSMIFLCFRFIAFLRIYRLQLLFKEIEKSVCMHRKLIFSIKFMCYLFLVQHGITCLWYLLARPIGHRNDVNWSNVLQNVSYHPKNVVDWYFVSSYAALSQLTRCGFGDILSTNSFERIASVVAMSFGILFTSMYISSLILLFVNANHPKHTIQKQVLLILTRLKLTENNTDVTDAILRYFEKFWTRKLGILYTKELNLLPDEISLQVHNDVNCTLLKCSVIFRTKPDEFLRKVSVLLRHEFYAPGENIYVENQIKYKLVIVKSGSVDILSEEDRVTPIITFGPRTCLGEASLILCLPANVTLRAATYVELQALYMKDFFTISTNYPEYFNEIRTVIFKRMYKMASHDRKDTNALKHLKHALAIKSSELLDPEHCATNLLSLYRYQDNVRRKRADSWLERARFPCILNRNTNVMLTWEFFIAACALFVAVLYPYYVTFEHRFPLWLEAVTDLIHVIFVLDIYVLLTTSVVKKGRVLNSFKSLLDERMDTVGFHLDVFASFYVEVFGYLAEDVDRVYYLLKLNRLLKVYRLSTLCERLQNKLIANSVCIAFAKYVTYLLLMVYWFSVLLYFQTCYYDSCVHNGWFIKEIADDVQSRILTATDKGKFFLALYFGSSTILGVCIGDVLPANLQDLSFVMGGLLVGTLVLGYCIAEMACHLRLELQSYFDFSEKMSLLEFHMQNRYVPDKLETRIVRYFDTQWECNEAYAFLSKTALLHNVPTYLQGDILKQERLDVLQKIGFFSNIDNSFMNYLVLHSSLVVLPPNEIVTYFGSISREMYVIYKGYCLQQTENNEYITVGPDKAIGYPSLLFGLPSLHNVFTITHCILVHINVNTFNEALMSAPGLHRIVYKARQSILAKYQGNFEVKIIENPQFVRKNKNKLKKLIEKNKTKSFVNAYKYCLVTGESYSHLSNRASRVCFPKYLLMPICILPYGPFLKLWVTVRLMITLVVGFCSPIMFVLAPYRQELHFALFLIDLFVYVDMYLMLHVGYYGPRDQLIFHPWKTAEHYLKGSFIVDLLIWFPLAPCMQVINSDHNEGHSAFAHGFSPHMFHCSVLLIRVFDVYRLPYAFKYLKGTLREHTFLVGLKYILYAMLCVHWWSIFLISKTCNFLHETDIRAANNSTPGMIPVPASDLNLYCKENSWVAASVHRNYSDFMDVYTTALYWTTSTMVGMGLGDIFAQNEGETLMSLLILLSGSLYFGYVLANIISRAIVTRDGLFSYEEKLLRLINYMRQEKLDKEFENKVREYLNYKWKRTRGFGIQTIISKMPSTLHEDTLLHLYEDTLRHVPMFEKVDQSFFRVLGKLLNEEYYLQDQLVVKLNDIVETIFIIHRGTVEILSPLNVIPISIGRGGVFGNIFEKEVSLCGISVRALKNLEVLCINVETFRRTIKDYPFIQKKINMFVKNQTHKNFVIPNNLVDDDEIYFTSKNRYWFNRRSISVTSKKSFIGACRASFSQKSYISNFVSCTILFAAYCNSMLTTYQFCFQHFCSQLLIVAIFIDVIFLLKFLLEINTPTYKRYIYTNLLDKCLHRRWNRTLDFLANLPFSYSLLFVPFISGGYANFYFSIWRLVTLLRVYYILKFLHTYKNRLMLNRFYLEASIFFVCLTLVCHLCACLWFTLICPLKKCEILPWKSSRHMTKPHELYLTCLYFMITIFTTTGTGDILPQTKMQMAFIIAAMIGSKIFLGYFIAQFVTILRSGNLFLIQYERSMQEVRNYFLNMGARKSQLKVVSEYLCLLWKQRRGLQISDLITELPLTLRIELVRSVYGSLLKDSYIFCQTEKDFIRQLTPLLKLRTYFPGNYIVRDGDADTCMYFIHRGDVEILSVNQNLNETVHEVLHMSEVFGIVQGLFREIPHHFSFRALTVTDILILKLGDWEYLLNFFPRSKEIIYQRVEEIYYTI